MQLDYDTHLKPATQIKKAKGENPAIDYLFELLNTNDWEYYDHWSILDKMTGYYKKANSENRTKIILELNKLLDGNKVVNYFAKVACYKRLAGLYEQEKEYEKAFQMLSGAMANNHPESSSYLLEASDISLRNAQIFARKNLLIEKNAADYLYWYFAHLLYTMAWYQIFPNDERAGVWKSNLNSLFPFEMTPTLQAFNTLSKKKSIKPFAVEFQVLLFKIFPREFVNRNHQTVAVEIVNRLVNGYLRSF